MRFWGMFRFTVGEAIRKGTLLFYFGIATLILVVFAFGIGRQQEHLEMITLFGRPLMPTVQPDFNVMDLLLVQLFSLARFWIILFGVFGVAGLIPDMLEKGTAELFLSKPLSRTELLFARSSGGVIGMSANMIYFILGIWCIFGVKLGVWHWGFFISMFYMVYVFACLFSFVALVGLITRSTGLTIMLTFAFTIISWGLELRESGLYVIWNNVIYHRFLDALYYILPQFDAMLDNTTRVIGKNPFIPNAPDLTYIPFLFSFLSSALLYGLAAFYFEKKDY